METPVAQILVWVIAGCLIITMMVGFVGNAIDAREKRHKEESIKRIPWDPAICRHHWSFSEGGACDKDTPGWTGKERPAWKVEVCSHCGSKRFICGFSTCSRYEECRAAYEAGAPEPGKIERELIDRVADAHGFEYAHYMLRDRFGNRREAWCRQVPTTIPFSCPDCGGMVEGVDAKRVWPGTTGDDPHAFRCAQCGRQESYDFGVPRTTMREGEPSFTAPRDVQPVCPRGGRHEWELVSEWSEMEFPEGVDGCLENMCLLEETWHKRYRCTKCGEEYVT